MKLIDINEQHNPFDVPLGQAEALLATGKVKKYDSTSKDSPKATHSTTFFVKSGFRVEDYEYPPFIAWICGKCGNGQIEGPTAHKQKLYHIPPYAFAQEIPSDVAVQFIEARRRWEKRHGKKFIDPSLRPRRGVESDPSGKTADAIVAQVKAGK